MWKKTKKKQMKLLETSKSLIPLNTRIPCLVSVISYSKKVWNILPVIELPQLLLYMTIIGACMKFALIHSVQAESDNKTTDILKQWLVDTSAWAWVEPFDKKQDFRKAYFSVEHYFNGPGQVSKRVHHAKAKLKTVFYKNEGAFPFDNFSSTVMTAMSVLDKDPEEKMSEGLSLEF